MCQKLTQGVAIGSRVLATRITVVEGFHRVSGRGDFLIEMEGPQEFYQLFQLLPREYSGSWGGKAAGPYRYIVTVTVEEIEEAALPRGNGDFSP